MEVDADSFPSQLLGILSAISESTFVAIDLELSGIPSKVRRPGNSGQQTLEERYAELKKAAETYMVLQVGITCVSHNVFTDEYILRPYNFNLNPMVDEQLELERNITFQNGAVCFLVKHGFDFDLPFKTGVPYLSREEAKLAKEAAYRRIDRTAMADLQLDEDAVDSLDFVRRVREAIVAWDREKPRELIIKADIGLAEKLENPDLGRFEKRLVHQLVRAEFPDLVTISRAGHIQIIKFDQEREAHIAQRKKTSAKEQIARATGFRWVIDALAKGTIYSFEGRYFAKNSQGMSITANIGDIETKFATVRYKLSKHQPVLVGHNLFTDLIYLYKTFIGELPDTLEGFKEAIHELFPVIVDTKYVATHNCGDINPMSSLQDIAEQLKHQRLPILRIHDDHGLYTHDIDVSHEAGYDSFLTATVMIRLSAKLDVQTSSNHSNRTANPMSSPNHTPAPTPVPVEVAAAEPSPSPTPIPPIPTQAKKKKKKKRKPTSQVSHNPQEPSTHPSIASSNLFDTLSPSPSNPLHAISTLQTPHTESLNNFPATESNTGKATASWATEPVVQEKEYSLKDPIIRAPMTLMPEFAAEFWEVYGNKLRVFGTVERVVKLGRSDEA